MNNRTSLAIFGFAGCRAVVKVVIVAAAETFVLILPLPPEQVPGLSLFCKILALWPAGTAETLSEGQLAPNPVGVKGAIPCKSL